MIDASVPRIITQEEFQLKYAALHKRQQELQTLIKQRSAELDDLRDDLKDVEHHPYNMWAESVEEVQDILNEHIHELATDSCGHHQQGLYEYRTYVYVNGVLHLAITKVEYNRHNYAYYYVDGVTTSVTPVEDKEVI